MSTLTKRGVRRGAGLLSVVALAGLGSVLATAAPVHATPKPVLRPREWRPARTPRQVSGLRAAARKSSGATNIPMFTKSFFDGASGHQYDSTLVGADPAVSNATTSVATKVIPLAIQLDGGSAYDPTAPDNCTGDIATKMTMASPIFKNRDYVFGGTDAGKGQYVDSFRRAEFWSDTGGGAHPKYHTKLSASLVKQKLTVTVPAGHWREYAASGACKLGVVDIDWLDNYLVNTAIPSLASAGVSTATFPVFLSSNLVAYDPTQPAGQDCCIGGYHSAYGNPFGGSVQTYAFADYETTGLFHGAFQDVSVLSHEVGEWMDDPLADNFSDSWGNIGQVQGCYPLYEVGDPLTGTNLSVAIKTTTYHVQELAFAGWFYHFTPSGGINGWYSLNGSFTSPAAPCP